MPGATTDPIAAGDPLAFCSLRQARQGFLDHCDMSVRQFAAGAGGGLIASTAPNQQATQ